MNTTTTENPAVLEGLLEAELFQGLKEITDEDIRLARVKRAKEIKRCGREGKGKAIGSLNQSEQALMSLAYKLQDEAHKTTVNELTSVLKAEDIDQADFDRRMKTFEETQRKKEKANFLESILDYLIKVRFRNEMTGENICLVWIDEEFNIRASTHEEEHPDRPKEEQ